jgi:ectoine hydroxylase-related dioxygenase (phytanoyl-CoA dioxygenase family)
LHNHLWHRSGTNRTGLPRRALTVCLMSESIRCVRRKRAPRSFVPLFRRG